MKKRIIVSVVVIAALMAVSYTFVSMGSPNYKRILRFKVADSGDINTDANTRGAMMDLIGARLAKLKLFDKKVQIRWTGNREVAVLSSYTNFGPKYFAYLLKSPKLEIRRVVDDPVVLKSLSEGKSIAGYEMSGSFVLRSEKTPILVESRNLAQGDIISNARVYYTKDAISRPFVAITLSDEGLRIMESAAKDNNGTTLALMFDGIVVITATIRGKIAGNEIRIAGNMSPDEAIAIAGILNAAAMPIRYELI